MTDLRTAAQQALEALEEYQSKGAPFLACDGAVDDLRAALAQQAEHICDTHCTWADHAAGCVRAEPVQEPVAISDGTFNHDCPIGTLLYTAPPRQKPLTDAEIPALAEQVLKLSVYYDVWALLGTDGLVALVRAVEQAHGIKE